MSAVRPPTWSSLFSSGWTSAAGPLLPARQQQRVALHSHSRCHSIRRRCCPPNRSGSSTRLLLPLLPLLVACAAVLLLLTLALLAYIALRPPVADSSPASQSPSPAAAMAQQQPSLAQLTAAASCNVSAVSTAVLSVSASRLQLVCVGDSLTQRSQQPDGWLTLLSHFYQRRLDGINRGFSGYNSDWLLALVRQQRSADPSKSNVWRLSEQPNVRSLYVLLIGANDAVLPPVSSNKQHVPLQRFQDNVDAIVRLLRGDASRGAASDLILVTPPATDPAAWAASHVASASSAPLVLTRSNANTEQYAERVRAVGVLHGVPVVDLFALSDVRQQQQQQSEQANPYLVDGLHLSPAGNLLLFRALLRCIDEQLPHLAIQRLELDSPYHADITHDNYAALFDIEGEQARMAPELNADLQADAEQ